MSIESSNQSPDRGYIDEYGFKMLEPIGYNNTVSYQHIGIDKEQGEEILKMLIKKEYVEGFEILRNKNSKDTRVVQTGSEVKLTQDGYNRIVKLEDTYLIKNFLSDEDKVNAKTPFIQN